MTSLVSRNLDLLYFLINNVTKGFSFMRLGLGVILSFLLIQTGFAQELKIGILLPFTGQYGWVGGSVAPVVRMVLDQVEQSGGIHGYRIVLRQGDTEGVVDAGTLAAQKLINVDDVVALIGPTSLSFSGAKQVIVDNQVPMISPTAGTVSLDKGCSGFCFRTVPSDSLGGYAIARAATDALKLDRSQPFKQPVLMIAQSPAMISFQQPLRDAFTKYQTPPLRVISYIPNKFNYRSEVQAAMAAGADLIVLVGTPADSARIMINAYQVGYRGGWFVTQDQTNDDYLSLLPAPIVEGVYGLEERADPTNAARNRAFEAAYQAFAGEPVKIFGPNTYDATTILSLALYHASRLDCAITRTTLLESIRVVSNPRPGDVIVTSFQEGKNALDNGHSINYQGLIGPVDFDLYGNIAAPFGIRQVRNGKWSDITLLTPEELR